MMARFMSRPLLSVTIVTCFPSDSSMVAMAMAPGGPSVSSGGLKGKHQQQSILDRHIDQYWSFSCCCAVMLPVSADGAVTAPCFYVFSFVYFQQVLLKFRTLTRLFLWATVVSHFQCKDWSLKSSDNMSYIRFSAEKLSTCLRSFKIVLMYYFCFLNEKQSLYFGKETIWWFSQILTEDHCIQLCVVPHDRLRLIAPLLTETSRSDWIINCVSAEKVELLTETSPNNVSSNPKTSSAEWRSDDQLTSSQCKIVFQLQSQTSEEFLSQSTFIYCSKNYREDSNLNESCTLPGELPAALLKEQSGVL